MKKSVTSFVASLVIATAFVSTSFVAHAATKEAPPMEPPYTNDSEFDPLMSEDPSANAAAPISTSEPIKSSNSQQPSQRKAQKAASEEFDDDMSADMPPSKTEVNSEAKKGVKMIHHPNAKKGLVLIQQDGTYVYKVKTKPTKNTGTVRFGQMQAPRIVSADGQTDFATMYETSALPMVMFDYAWQPFTNFGKLGAEIGVGLAMTTGKGRFLKRPGERAEETYTFVAIPLNAGVNYRFQYARNQWVAPYVAGGLSYIGVAELRDDNKQNFTGTPAAYGAGGLMFNIGAFDRDVAFNLQNEYGVGGLWLSAEFRYQNAFSEDLDFSGSIVSFGVSAEF